MLRQSAWLLLSVLLTPACGSYRPSEPSCVPANAGAADGIPCGLPWNGPTGSCRHQAWSICGTGWSPTGQIGWEYVVKSEQEFDELFECSHPAGAGDAGTLWDGGTAESPASGIDFARQRLVVACRMDQAIVWALHHDGVVSIGVRNPVRCGGAPHFEPSIVLVPNTDGGLKLYECPQANCVCDNPFGCNSAP